MLLQQNTPRRRYIGISGGSRGREARGHTWTRAHHVARLPVRAGVCKCPARHRWVGPACWGRSAAAPTLAGPVESRIWAPNFKGRGRSNLGPLRATEILGRRNTQNPFAPLLAVVAQARLLACLFVCLWGAWGDMLCIPLHPFRPFLLPTGGHRRLHLLRTRTAPSRVARAVRIARGKLKLKRASACCGLLPPRARFGAYDGSIDPQHTPSRQLTTYPRQQQAPTHSDAGRHASLRGSPIAPDSFGPPKFGRSTDGLMTDTPPFPFRTPSLNQAQARGLQVDPLQPCAP